ncbi:MAG TPA: SGNH/GDSL hydrolase family protein, partial [Armatimonadota bacterium]
MLDEIKSMIKEERPLTWVFTGDSITHGVVWTLGLRDYVELFEERLRNELWRTHDFVVNTAVNGWRTGDLKENIERHILDINPDVVSIMMGMNDASTGRDGLEGFEQNYRFIIDKIQERTSARILLHTPNPTMPSDTVMRREALPAFAAKIRTLADEYHCGVIDHYEYWLKAWEDYAIRTNMWMADSIHPSEYGH